MVPGITYCQPQKRVIITPATFMPKNLVICYWINITVGENYHKTTVALLSRKDFVKTSPGLPAYLTLCDLPKAPCATSKSEMLPRPVSGRVPLAAVNSPLGGHQGPTHGPNRSPLRCQRRGPKSGPKAAHMLPEQSKIDMLSRPISGRVPLAAVKSPPRGHTGPTHGPNSSPIHCQRRGPKSGPKVAHMLLEQVEKKRCGSHFEKSHTLTPFFCSHTKKIILHSNNNANQPEEEQNLFLIIPKGGNMISVHQQILALSRLKSSDSSWAHRKITRWSCLQQKSECNSCSYCKQHDYSRTIYNAPQHAQEQLKPADKSSTDIQYARLTSAANNNNKRLIYNHKRLISVTRKSYVYLSIKEMDFFVVSHSGLPPLFNSKPSLIKRSLSLPRCKIIHQTVLRNVTHQYIVLHNYPNWLHHREHKSQSTGKILITSQHCTSNVEGVSAPVHIANLGGGTEEVPAPVEAKAPAPAEVNIRTHRGWP